MVHHTAGMTWVMAWVMAWVTDGKSDVGGP